MGGTKSGSQTTINQPLTKKQYDPTGYKYREQLLPKLMAKYDIGLTPQEKAYYTGQGLTELEKNYAAQLQNMREAFGRAGLAESDGAYLEALSDMLRGKLQSRTGLRSDIVGKDIAMKQQNLANLLNLIADSGALMAGAQTTTYTPASGSTLKNVIGGGLSGALGGSMLNTALGGTLGPWGAVGGAVLGGLGGLL